MSSLLRHAKYEPRMCYIYNWTASYCYLFQVKFFAIFLLMKLLIQSLLYTVETLMQKLCKKKTLLNFEVVHFELIGL